MDAAKIMWVMYEHPEVDFEDLALRFMDIRKRIYTFPKMGKKANLIAIPTTSGTGSEVTPFAVVTDDATGMKYPIADYELTPTMAIVDANLVMNLPKALTAFGGIDAVTHALEAYVSVMANEFSDAQALQALQAAQGVPAASYEKGAKDPEAREKVHNAATMAGMAFANAFLGVCHSMAHKLGAAFHLPHGLANALLITQRDPLQRQRQSRPSRRPSRSTTARRPAAATPRSPITSAWAAQTKDEQVENLIAWVDGSEEGSGHSRLDPGGRASTRTTSWPSSTSWP